jgi:hypothetical protein
MPVRWIETAFSVSIPLHAQNRPRYSDAIGCIEFWREWYMEHIVLAGEFDCVIKLSCEKSLN